MPNNSLLLYNRSVENLINLFSTQFVPFRGLKGRKKGMLVNYARSKKSLIKNNYIIESAHPSPFSARNGFFGSKPFSKTNEYLKSKGLKEINW